MRWKERKLYRSVLKDFALGEDPELFFKRCSDGEFTDDYGLDCTVESWLWRWYADFGGTFYEVERFFKVEDRHWFQVNRGCVAMAMAVVRCVCLASNLVGLRRALVAFPCFCPVGCLGSRLKFPQSQADVFDVKTSRRLGIRQYQASEDFCEFVLASV